MKMVVTLMTFWLAAACTHVPTELPEARLSLVKPMPLCVFNCRIIIQQTTALSEGQGPIVESAGSVTEMDVKNAEPPKVVTEEKK